MAEPLAGRKVLVTGASRGIGRAIAERLAQSGAELALIARGSVELAASADRCRALGAKVHLEVADVTDPRINGAIDRSERALGGLDAVIHSAGLGHLGPVVGADLESWSHVLDTNLFGAMTVTHRALPHLLKSPRSPAVVFIASISSKITYSGGTAYCASKHGLLGFAGALFEEVHERGVRVSSICPGWVDTEMITGLGNEIDRGTIMQPDDVAEAVLFVLCFPGRGCPTEIVLRNMQQPYA